MERFLTLAIVAVMSGYANAADWPPAMDYLNERSLACTTNIKRALCEQAKRFWLEDYDKAIQGDYNGQRNIAGCLSTGCDGAIVPNPILGCAWRIVVANSGHLQGNKLDADWLKIYCGPQFLDDAGRTMANAQAGTILQKLGLASN